MYMLNLNVIAKSKVFWRKKNNLINLIKHFTSRYLDQGQGGREYVSFMNGYKEHMNKPGTKQMYIISFVLLIYNLSLLMKKTHIWMEILS